MKFARITGERVLDYLGIRRKLCGSYRQTLFRFFQIGSPNLKTLDYSFCKTID